MNELERKAWAVVAMAGLIRNKVLNRDYVLASGLLDELQISVDELGLDLKQKVNQRMKRGHKSHARFRSL